MTDNSTNDLNVNDWILVEATGFSRLLGSIWQRRVDGSYEYALVADERHENRLGTVHGGAIMTFADRTCGITARLESGNPVVATVQLDTHFVGSANIGETLVSRTRIVRSTAHLAFISAEIKCDNRAIAVANGIFKYVRRS
jgi:uncharacterized protein (TIGR00369 family)